jgi:hypothetical protein
MKKFLALLLIAALVFAPGAFAGGIIQGIDSNGKTQNVSVDSTGLLNVGRSPASSKPIDAVTLNANPTSYTSAVIALNGAQRVGFFASYDETQVGNTVGGTLTIEVSPDNSTWFTANFYDLASPATLVASEIWTADATYVCWLDRNMPFPYVRVKVVATNTDADDVVLMNVYAYIDR